MKNILFPVICLIFIAASTQVASANVNERACKALPECSYAPYSPAKPTQNNSDEPESNPAQCFCGNYQNSDEAVTELRKIQAQNVTQEPKDCFIQWVGSLEIGQAPGHFWIRCE